MFVCLVVSVAGGPLAIVTATPASAECPADPAVDCAMVAASDAMYGPADGYNNTGERGPYSVEELMTDVGVSPTTLALRTAEEAQLAATVPYDLVHYFDLPATTMTMSGSGYCIPIENRQASGPVDGEPVPCSAFLPEPHPATGFAPLIMHQQNTGYTCAPASARSILHAATGVDLGESYLANKMGTKPAGGTYWKLMIRTMNEERRSTSVFIGEPEYKEVSPARLMGMAMSSIKTHQRGPIYNVNQTFLKHWNRPVINTDDDSEPAHYLPGYAYDLRNGGWLYLADIARGAPFGEHRVPLSEAWTAVVENKGLVIR